MFTDAQVVPFLSHPDALVRDLAASYFREHRTPSPLAACDALRAYDLYPDGEFGPNVSDIREASVTPGCVSEILARLAAGPPAPLADALHSALINMPLATLDAASAELLIHPALPREVHDHLEFQLSQLKHSPDFLWERFLEMADLREKAWQKDEKAPFSEDTVWAVKHALARHPDFTAPRVMGILSDASIEGYRETDAVDVAGLLKLDSTVPLLIDKLLVDADILNESTVRALAAIGGADIVRRLAEFVPGKDWNVKLFAIAPLDRIKVPEAEDALLALMEQEESLDLKTNLAYGLCLQISRKGFDHVRRMVIDDAYDHSMVSLDEALAGLAVMLDIDFPQAADIRRQSQERVRLRRQDMANFDFMKTLNRLAGLVPQPGARGMDVDEPDPILTLEDMRSRPWQDEPVVAGSKIGRNDPCPCGSGKKHKKCCGR